MALVRKAGTGQLVETELQGANGQPLAAPTPTSPAGTAAAGGSLDQAKMSGTPAQKTPVLAEAVAPAQTLQTAQRAQAAQAQADPSAYQQAQDKLGALKGYGSYADRLQGIIQSRLQGIVAAAPQAKVAAAGLERYAGDPAKQTAVKSSLEAYLANPSDAALQAVAQAMAGPDLTPVAALEELKAGGLASMLEGSASTLAAFGTGLAKVTVADMAAENQAKGIAAWDLDQMAQDLGVPRAELETWSPDQLQAKLQGVAGADLAQTDALQAELASASPQRAQQIRAELARLGVSGVSATEAESRALADSLEAQEEVQIGGQSVNIQTLLADDKVSDIIRNAVGSPQALADLKADPLTASLASWIETHMASLQQVVDDANVQATSLDAAQDDFAKAFSGLDPTALKALGIDTTKVYTPEELVAKRAEVEASPLYKALTDPKTKVAVAAALETNPALAQQLIDAGVAAADMPRLIEANQTLQALSTEQKQGLKALGIDVAQFITDPAVAGRAMASWQLINSAGTAGALVLNDPAMWTTKQRRVAPQPGDTGPRYETVKEPSAMARLLQNPEVLKEALAAAKALDGADDSLKTLMGVSSWYPKNGDVKALRARTTKMQEMAKAYASASSMHTDERLAQLIKAGVIDTAAELRTLTPAKLEAAEAAHADRGLMTAMTKGLSTNSPNNTFASVAKLVLGHSATGEQFQRMLDQARAARSSDNPVMRKGAKDFFASMAFLDTNKDGIVSREDILQTNNVEGDYGISPEFKAAAAKWATGGDAALAGKPSPFAALRKTVAALDPEDPWGTEYEATETRKATEAGNKVVSSAWNLTNTVNRWKTGRHGETIEWTENTYEAIDTLANGKTKRSGRTKTEKVNERVTKAPQGTPRAAGEVGADSNAPTNNMAE